MIFLSRISDAALSLRRNRAFTAVSVLILALGIGANAAVFTIVNSILLRQLPLRNPGELVWVWVTLTDRDRAFFSILNFLDTREQTRTFADLAAFANIGANLTGVDDPERLQGVVITPNAFELLGTGAAAGRTFVAADGRAGSGGRVAMLTYGLWQRRFGGDAGIVGQSILLNNEPYTVVGVLPRHFVFPVSTDAEFAAPLILETDPRRAERGSRFLRVFGRLRPNATIAEARSELAAIFERLRTQYPADNGKHTAPRVLPLQTEIVGDYGALLWTLFAAVAAVLMISCSNLAGMLLARSSARRTEFAIRAAIGASRRDLVFQLMAESFLIGLCGGALGLLIAQLGLSNWIALGPAGLPRANEISLDARVVAFTTGISILAVLLFGLAPGLDAGRLDLHAELKGGRGSAAGFRNGRLRRLLVTAEVAMSVVLLITAGLFLRSFARLQSVDAGVHADHVLLARLSVPTASGFKEFSDKLMLALAAEPGFESAALASVLPLSGMNTRTDFTIAGRAPLRPADIPGAQNRWVGPGYFQILGIPIVRGRGFSEFDNRNSQAVAVVDRALAERFFAGEDPLGKHLNVTDGPVGRDVEIVGIAGNVKHFNLDEPPTPTLYCPLDQAPAGTLGFIATSFHLVSKTRGDPLGYADAVRKTIRNADKNVATSGIRTMDEFLSATLASRRFNLVLIEVFAASGLLLAAFGLYGLISHTVEQRRGEIAIRVALGADRRKVLGLVVGEGLRLIVAGAVIGLVAAALVSRALSDQLFGISPIDPPTFVLIPFILLFVGILAAYMPARRAAKQLRLTL